MSSNPRGLPHDTTAGQPFLYSKTVGPSAPIHPDAGPLPEDGIDSLVERYPGLRVGQAYHDWAAEKVAAGARFAALALRIDMPAHRRAGDLERLQQQRLATAAAIDRQTAGQNALWGLVAADIFGWVLPGLDVAAALAQAKKLQDRLNAESGITLTIGLAGFPCLQYTPSDVLANAHKAMDHALFLGPGGRACFDAVSLNISGDRYYDAGNIDQAIQEFRQALRLDPKNVNVLNSLGVCFGVQQNYPKALTAFRAALKNNPREILALYNAGLVNLLLDQREEALALWLKAAPLGPDVFELHFQAGKLLLESGNPEKALPLLQRAAALKPESAVVQRLLGDTFRAQRLLEEAVGPYKKALRLHPNDAHALSGLGRCYELKNENLDIALAFCQQSVEIKPDQGLFHIRLARLLKKTGQYRKALQAFKQAAALGEDAQASIRELEDRCVDKAS